MTVADIYRDGLADATVRIALARIWPMSRADDICKAAGVTQAEFRTALNKVRGIKPAAPPPPKPSRSKKPVGPPGTKWCVRCKRHVKHEDFGVNRSRPDGFSDFCKECWRDYWRERRSGKPS